MIYFAGMLGDWLSSSVGNGVPGILDIGIRSLSFSIATFIYQLIISFYNIFEKLCSGRFFDSDMLKSFSERVGVVLGVVMLFIAIFSMIKMVVDPDKITDKEMGATALIKKTVIVMVMLGVSNFAFSFLYKVQDVVLEEDIISKILLPIRVDESNSTSFGNILSEELFMSFYKMEDNIDSSENVAYCENVMEQFKDQIITSGNFNLGRECLSESVKVQSGGGTIETFLINYNWLLSLIAGVAVAYLIFSYCISVGIRMIQLLFLEIISPMAIISYLIPKKDTMFGKWGKIYIATYIDVFIRVAVIDFIVFIIAAIFSSEFSFSFINSAEGAERSLMVVIIIIALLTFAKKAPDLLKDLFPASASKLGLGVNSPKKILDGMLGGNAIRTGAKVATVGAAIGLGGAIMSGMSRYKINMKNSGVNKDYKNSEDEKERKAYADARRKALLGAAGGSVMALGRGLKSGASAKGNVFKSVGEGWKTQRGVDDKYDELISSGGTPMGAFKAKLSSFVGETQGQTYTRHMGYMDKVESFKKDVQAYADEIIAVKNAKDAWQNIVQWSGEPLHEFKRRKQRAFEEYRVLRNAAIDAAYDGKSEFSGVGQIFITDSAGNQIFDYPKDDNGNYIYEKDDNGNYVYEKDENGNAILDEKGIPKPKAKPRIERVEVSGEMIADDPLYAADIRNKVQEIRNYYESHNIEYYDGNSDNVVKVKEFVVNGTELSKALAEHSQFAHKTKAVITHEPDYDSAIADDKNAGVNSGATTNKK